MWALVPVKDLAGAKKRLSPVLSSGERQGLYRAMLSDVLRALSSTASLDGIALITKDAEAELMAAEYGASVIAEAENGG